jgi:hypothetical protein
VDALPIFLKKLGKKAAIFDVDFYLGWGTPKDLYDYQKLEYFIKNNVPAKGISDENEKLLSSWKRYFKEKG